MTKLMFSAAVLEWVVLTCTDVDCSSLISLQASWSVPESRRTLLLAYEETSTLELLEMLSSDTEVGVVSPSACSLIILCKSRSTTFCV